MKVGIVGAGGVGSACLLSLVMRGIACQVIVIDKNPARKLAMPPTRRPCGRFLTMEEFDALLAQLEFRDHLITRMFCTMGFRPGELFALRWDDIETAVSELMNPRPVGG